MILNYRMRASINRSQLVTAPFNLFLLYVYGQILIKVHNLKNIFWIEAVPFNGVGTVFTKVHFKYCLMLVREHPPAIWMQSCQT